MSELKVSQGLGVTAVRAYDPQRRSWLVDGTAGDGLPELDGTVTVDAEVLARYANDVGGMVRNRPAAVLLPRSVSDIQAIVRFAARHGIKLAARGEGHTTDGQSQVEGGLIVDMRFLDKIHSIEQTKVSVDAGATWDKVVGETVSRGLTPPALTGYLGLSIGGTLSVGGVPQTYSRGVQVDRVQELDVVTGQGELRRCSMQEDRDLFEAALAGLGQCGIITRAVLDLVPAPEMARVFLLNYADNARFFGDFRALLERDEFDKLNMFGVPQGSAGWTQQLCAVKFFDAGHPPDNNHLLRDLRIDRAVVPALDMPYLEHVRSVDVGINALQQMGLWKDVLHPWFDVWLPESAVEQYVGETLSGLAHEDVGAVGFLLLFAQERSKLTRPFLRTPLTGKHVYLFDILTSAGAPGPNAAFQERMLARNRALFEKARAVGGTRYPIGSMPFEPNDWVREYGSSFARFESLKQRFDPAGILTPGPGIFARSGA